MSTKVTNYNLCFKNLYLQSATSAQHSACIYPTKAENHQKLSLGGGKKRRPRRAAFLTRARISAGDGERYFPEMSLPVA